MPRKSTVAPVSSQRGEILLLDPGDIAGGGQRFGIRLARELQRRGQATRCGCPSDSSLADWCHEARIEVTDLRFPVLIPWKLPSIAAGVACTRHLLRELGPDAIVIGNHPRAHAYLYAASRFLRDAPPTVNIVHEQETAGRISARFVYRRFGAMLVIGATAADEYRRRIPGVAITKTNNFLSREYFREAAARPRSRGGGRAPVLGVLARMTPEKGILELVNEVATETVLPLWSELRVGAPFQDPAYVRRVQRSVDAHGLGDRVRLLGEVEDVPGFFGSIDALVVPSTGNEAQPTVILEALAHGLPVVLREPVWSSDFEGLPVFRYRDPFDLGKALRELRSASATADELVRRFGPDQAVAALEQAVQAARARS
jgi:glycosyltransferase involved in cell wall biosynthesis